jgi:hypothetical protein
MRLMIKQTVFVLIGFFISSLALHAQQAALYFPSGTFKWAYRISALDSNNAVQSQRLELDSVGASTVMYQGKTARRIFTDIRTNARDTAHVNLENTTGSTFFDAGNLGIPTTIPIAGLERWYSVYRFAQAVNVDYPILDTVVTVRIDSTNVPLRLTLLGRRLSDQSIATPAGAFANAKRFLLSANVGLQVLPLPAPPIALFTLPDTTWIADATWIVKSHVPSLRVNLSQLGLPSFTIPGRLAELVPESFLSIRTDIHAPKEFALHQNFPNPFNPSTEIEYQISEVSDVHLEVFDMLGRKVATLVNERKQTGLYQVRFNAASLTSGMYFYRLSTTRFVETRRMTLMK